MKTELSVVSIAVLAASAFLGAGSAHSAQAPSVAHECGETRTVVLPGGATMELVWCPPGKFAMGSPPDEIGRLDDEPLHQVTITRGFWLGKYEVTQRQWESVMRNNHSRFKGKDNPVENISWHDCETFVHRINAVLGGAARFPTEAEWEYACRAGSSTPFSGGAEIDDMAWYDMNSDNRTHEVGRNRPNAWGLYDMHGNVLEWCKDWFAPLSGAAAVDPEGPPSGSFKAIRGGCWFSYGSDCRCSYRLRREPSLRNCIFGFRLACSDFDDTMQLQAK
ncbi:MAG: formylglycine-generating enzyme family protein [Kiritimatiellae bacterium]|nr:formylglycine-generating enzyme family protein [Kiritimatiellia bacterium]